MPAHAAGTAGRAGPAGAPGAGCRCGATGLTRERGTRARRGTEPGRAPARLLCMLTIHSFALSLSQCALTRCTISVSVPRASRRWHVWSVDAVLGPHRWWTRVRLLTHLSPLERVPVPPERCHPALTSLHSHRARIVHMHLVAALWRALPRRAQVPSQPPQCAQRSAPAWRLPPRPLCEAHRVECAPCHLDGKRHVLADQGREIGAAAAACKVHDRVRRRVGQRYRRVD